RHVILLLVMRNQCKALAAGHEKDLRLKFNRFGCFYTKRPSFERPLPLLAMRHSTDGLSSGIGPMAGSSSSDAAAGITAIGATDGASAAPPNVAAWMESTDGAAITDEQALGRSETIASRGFTGFVPGFGGFGGAHGSFVNHHASDLPHPSSAGTGSCGLHEVAPGGHLMRMWKCESWP